MKLTLIIALPFLLISSHARVSDSSLTTADRTFSLKTTKTLCLLTGINYSTHVFADVGISVNSASLDGIYPVSASFFAAGEVHLQPIESSRGISPLRFHRTVHESLPSHGSSYF